MKLTSNKEFTLERDIHIYVLNKLRESSLKFAEVIHKSLNIPDIFLICFPNLTIKLIEDYGKGIVSNQEFWEDWKQLFGLTDPFVNALQNQLDPVLQVIPFLFKKKPEIRIIPYQDNYYFQMTEQFKEQIFLLTYKTRVTKKINLKAWKELLHDDYEWTESQNEKNIENILKNLQNKNQSAILYQGSARNLRKILKLKGYHPKMKYLMKYWRAPLEVLTYLIGLKGIQNIPERCIDQCIQEHVSYIDFILTEPSIDAAHKRWTNETFKFQ